MLSWTGGAKPRRGARGRHRPEGSKTIAESQDPIVQDLCDTLTRLARDEELTAPLADCEVELLQTLARALGQGLPVKTVFTVACSLYNHRGELKPEAKRPDALLAEVVALGARLRPAELRDADVGAVVRSVAEHEASEEEMAAVMLRELGSLAERDVHKALMLVHVLESILEHEPHPEAQRTVLDFVEDALAVDPSADPADLVRETCQRALAFLGDRRLNRQLPRHELLFARRFVNALLQGVEPVQVWSVLRFDDDLDLKPERKLPDELCAKIRDLTHGVGLVVQEADHFGAIAAISHLAMTLPFKLPRREVEAMSRLLQDLTKRAIAVHN